MEIGDTIKVWINDLPVPVPRKQVDAIIKAVKPTSIIVQLPDGREIKRKRKRDI